MQLGFKVLGRSVEHAIPDTNADYGTKNRDTHFKLETIIPAANFADFTEGNGLCKRCNLTEAHYHCALCPASTSFSYQSKFFRHMQQTHLHVKRILIFNDLQLIPCKLLHLEKKFLRTYAYHCPYCPSIIQQNKYVYAHLERHLNGKAMGAVSIRNECSVFEKETHSQRCPTPLVTDLQGGCETVKTVDALPDSVTDRERLPDSLTDHNC